MLLRLLVAAAALLSVPTVAHAAVRGFDGSGRLVVHYDEPRGVLGVEADGTVTPVVETAGMEAAIGSEVIVRDGHVVAAREVQTPPAITYRTLVLPLTATDSTTTTTPTTRRGTRAPTLTLTPRPGRKAVKLGARRSLRIAARDDKPASGSP
jgi:hypothetical protein